jgi:hypothetical protein
MTARNNTRKVGITNPQRSNEYVTRLTWNNEGWQRPSGAHAKAEKDTFVAKNGFGHEEWLNRGEWLLDGFRYAFLQGVHRSRTRLIGETLHIFLYTINPLKQRLYVGELKAAEVIDDKAARRAVQQLRRRGILKTMKHEVGVVAGNRSALQPGPSHTMVNIRFRPGTLTIYKTPIFARSGDRILRFSRYAVIRADDRVLKEWKKRVGRRPRQYPGLTDPKIYELARRMVKAEATETRMENELEELLQRRFGKEKVEAQRDFVDLTLTTADRSVLIEIKASEQARRAIRDALGQLLGYAYQARHGQKAELVIVGRGTPTPDTRRYLDYLRTRFRLDIAYCRYVLGSHRLPLVLARNRKRKR